MIKETIIKEDGRLLTFYSFADKAKEATAEADDSKPCCCCGDSEKVADSKE